MADVYTDVGEEVETDYFDATTSPPADYYIGWGTGAGTAAKGDTTLFTEASEDRVTASMSQPAANTTQAIGTLTADGVKTITNAGLMDAITSGNLIIHGDHAGVLLAGGDKIEYTITLARA